MPTALRLQREYPHDLQVLLVDVQGEDIEGVERSRLTHGWMGSDAMWTTARPIEPIESGIPYAVMLDADGRVALTGYVSRIKQEIEAWLQESSEQRATPPAILPEILVPAWKALRRDRLAAAIRLAESVEIGEDTKVRVAQSRLLDEVRGRVSAEMDRLDRTIEDGEVLTAHELVSQLADVDPRADRARLRFETGDLAAELTAARALRTLAQPLFFDGPDARLAEAFDAFVERHPGTHAAARASRYAEACRGG